MVMLDDNPDFGGHQVMAAYGLEGMLQFGDWEVLGLVHPENSKNRERWQALADQAGQGRFQIESAPTRSAKFQAVRRFWQGQRIEQLRQRILAYQPALVVVIQGNIEQGCSAFRLRGKVNCPIVSYIPVPHRHTEMGAKLGALRDLTCRGLYAEPDGFITISETLARMLRDYGAKGRVQVVENGIPLEHFHALPGKAAARVQFNLPDDAFIWGQIGRTEFKQKGQDFALELFHERARKVPGEHLVFLGSGPDTDALLAAASGQPNLHCLPWTPNPAPLYRALDALLLPSRYEGVPLAMLEALANGLPVASTDRDGMRDWLPEEWRFPYRDRDAGLAAMQSVAAAAPTQVEALKARVWQSHSLRSFQQAYNAALEAWL